MAIADGQPPKPEPIPAHSDFPSDDNLFDALQRGDVIRMRSHAWKIFGGITSEAKGRGVPIFMTWATRENLFPSPTPAGGRKAVRLGFEIPRQFLELTDQKTKSAKATETTSPVLSKIYYNSTLADDIATRNLNQPKTFLNLLKTFDKHSVPTENRQINAFPAGAIAVKTAWWVVHANQLTLVPVWDPDSNSAVVAGNSPVSSSDASQWSRYVAVDAKRRTGSKEYVDLETNDLPPQHARVVPLSSFFRIKLDTAEKAAEIGALAGIPADAGDYLILVGLHLTTKEIPNWVWATFWWHDLPDAGLYAMQRPSSVTGKWRNYLMNVAYSMIDPREPDGGAHIAFNPWLEAPLPGGLTSNCMSCHQLAAWPPLCQDTHRGETSIADARFSSRVRLDFLWSLTRTAPACSSLLR